MLKFLDKSKSSRNMRSRLKVTRLAQLASLNLIRLVASSLDCLILLTSLYQFIY